MSTIKINLCLNLIVKSNYHEMNVIGSNEQNLGIVP